MGDGPQTLLDVIDDSHVLDKFFETFPSATLDDSPRFDNVATGAETNLLPNGIDLNFDALSEPPRGTSSYVSHLPTSSHFLHPPSFGANAMVNSTASSQLFAHALHPVHLSNPNAVPGHQHAQQPLQSSLPVSDSSDSLSRAEQDPLHQFLANGPSLAGSIQTQQTMQPNHNFHQTVANQENISGALHLGASTSMLHASHNLGRAGVSKASVSSTDADLSSVLMPNHFSSQTPVPLIPTSSINSQQKTSRGAHDAHASRIITAHKNSTSIHTANSTKENLVTSQRHLHNISLTGAAQIVSGQSLASQPGQVIANSTAFVNSGMLHSGQVFQNHCIVPGTSHSASHETAIHTTNGIYNMPHISGGAYSPQIALSSSSAVISTTSITSSTATTSCITSFSSASKSPIASAPKVSPGRHGHTSSKSGKNNSTKASSHFQNIKSPVVSQTISTSPSLSGTAQTNLASLVPGLGVVQGLVAPLSGSNGVISTTTNAPQVSSNVKQMVPGSQLIQIVSSQPSNPPRNTTIHSLPKPIQPKQPQLLPKPCQGVVRQPTPPPPPGKTLIGNRPQAVSSQQPLLIGGNQQSTVLAGQPNLGPILLNPSILQSGVQQPVLLTQNGMQILLRPPAPANNPGQAIILPVPGQSQVLPPVGKVGTSQTINACTPQGLATYVINPGLGSSLSGNTVFATSQGHTRNSAPILRLVAPQAAPLQLQQIQSPNGPTFIALPGQSPFNLPGVFASGSVRTINPQVAPGTLQLAPQLAQMPTMGNIQLPTALSSISGQNVQLNPTSLSTSGVVTGPSLAPSSSQQHIVVKCSQPSTSKKEEKIAINVSSPPDPRITKKKKSSKKKKEPIETKKDDKVVSINLNELLKQNGIGDGMIFEENEFESIGMENLDSCLVPESKPSQPAPTLPSVSSIATEAPSQVIPPLLTTNASATSNIGQMCLAMDANGKLVVCQQDFSKGLPNNPGLQLAPSVMPTNAPLLNATSTGSFIIANPTTGFATNNLSQLVALPTVSTALSSPVAKAVSTKATESQQLSLPKSQDMAINAANSLTNTINKTAEYSSRIQVTIPQKHNTESSEPLLAPRQEFNVESKSKKPKKKSSKDKKSPHPTHPVLLPNHSKSEVPKKASSPEKVLGDSMPTFSFGILSPDGAKSNLSPTTSPMATPASVYHNSSKGRVSTITSPVTKPSPGSEWPQLPMQELPKVYLTQKNSDIFHNIQMQVNALESQVTLDAKDHINLQRLKAEQKKIIANAEHKTPGKLSQKQTVTNNATLTPRASIKYSHSVGHKKILLSPNQKKPTHAATSKETRIEPTNSIKPSLDPAVQTPVSSVSPKCYETSRTINNACSPGNLPNCGKSGNIPAVAEFNESKRQIIPLCSPLTPTKSFHPSSPVQNSGVPLTRGQLFEHQLLTDRNGAVQPDYTTPFKSKVDACKRLVRYHVYFEKDDPPEVIEQCERNFSDISEALIRKKNLLQSRFQSLLLKDSMRPYATAEDALIHKLALNEEKLNFEKEKAEVMKNKELKYHSHPSRWKIGSSTPLADPLATYGWEDGKLFHQDPTSGILINLSESIPKVEIEPIPQDFLDSEEEFQDEPRLTILEDEISEDTETNTHSGVPTPSVSCSSEMDSCSSYSQVAQEVPSVHVSPIAKESSHPNGLVTEVCEKTSQSGSENRKSRDSKKKRHKRKNRDPDSSERKSYKKGKSNAESSHSPPKAVEEPSSGGLKLKLKKQLGSSDYYRVGGDLRKCEKMPPRFVHSPTKHPTSNHIYPAGHFMSSGDGGFPYGAATYCHFQGYPCPPPNPPSSQDAYSSLGLPPNYMRKWGT